MSGSVPCTVFLPGSSQGLVGSASARAQSMFFEWEGGAIEFPYHALSLSKGGYDNRKLVFSGEGEDGGYTFYCDAGPVREALSHFRLPPGFSSQVSKASAGGGFKGVIGWLLLGAAVLVGLYFAVMAGFDSAIDFAVENIPVEMEVELGKAAAGQQLGDMQVCSAPAVLGAMEEMSGRLVGALGETPYTWRVLVVDVPDVNAFALPGGYIFINWGLIDKADSADEVAGVLAHEIQHAVHRHGLRNVIARAGITLVVALAFGDAQGLAGLVAGASGELAALSFSREQEEEADREGMKLLIAAGFDPQGMPTFFAKLKEEQKKKGLDLPSFMSTHPDTDARIENLRQLIESNEEPHINPLSLPWEQVKTAGCIPLRHADPDKAVGE